MMSKDSEKAYFIQRLFAFLIDVIIVSFISLILSMPFQNSDSIQKLSNQSKEYSDSYIEGKIGFSEYLNKSANINYHLAKESGVSSIITIFLNVLYFIVIQKILNGQTIGKKVFKIKVIKNDDSDLTMNDMVLRGLVNNSIWGDIIIAALLLISKNCYFYGSLLLQVICGVIMVVSAFMILIRKDGRSVADFVSGTRVIDVKEK